MIGEVWLDPTMGAGTKLPPLAWSYRRKAGGMSICEFGLAYS